MVITIWLVVITIIIAQLHKRILSSYNIEMSVIDQIVELPDELKAHIYSFIKDDYRIRLNLLKQKYAPFYSILERYVLFHREKYLLGVFYNYFPLDRTKFSYLVVDAVEYHRTQFNIRNIQPDEWKKYEYREDRSNYKQICLEIVFRMNEIEQIPDAIELLYKMYLAYIYIGQTISPKTLYGVE